jgi:hypothetical protein
LTIPLIALYTGTGMYSYLNGSVPITPYLKGKSHEKVCEIMT